ncbi:hypothetical protein PR003_g17446 [Phytophthora rubi]|uniref:Uncharacterized protein n=1 Tax=Phytophthora rubi TaxID=129364 RepID=A0A6A4EFC2_9STRA|nr:hypothetical protein PR001_g22747 [Phytophthora rubi]KAE9007171.1 hypothetical protein PR002_g16284 [Phytophthora rubi]KAE9321538.1 hypothetical protein PR003_g17446 [Phytophthora rubi]
MTGTTGLCQAWSRSCKRREQLPGLGQAVVNATWKFRALVAW